MVNKFTRDSLKMIDDTTDETDRLPDDFGVAGRAAAHITEDGREPAVIRGSERIEHADGESIRVLLDLESQDQLLNTDRERVEVLN